MNELLLPIGLIVVVAVVVLVMVKKIKKEQNKPSKAAPKSNPVQVNTPQVTATAPKAPTKKEEVIGKPAEVQEAIAKPKRKPRTKKSEDEGKKSEPKKSLARKAPKKK